LVSSKIKGNPTTPVTHLCQSYTYFRFIFMKCWRLQLGSVGSEFVSDFGSVTRLFDTHVYASYLVPIKLIKRQATQIGASKQAIADFNSSLDRAEQEVLFNGKIFSVPPWSANSMRMPGMNGNGTYGSKDAPFRHDSISNKHLPRCPHVTYLPMLGILSVPPARYMSEHVNGTDGPHHQTPSIGSVGHPWHFVVPSHAVWQVQSFTVTSVLWQGQPGLLDTAQEWSNRASPGRALGAADVSWSGQMGWNPP
jgi:hypothetical protein